MSGLAFAAEGRIAGNWTITGDVQGYPVNEKCTLTGSDDKLAGSCTSESGKYDATGSLAGETLTIKHGGQYQGQALTLTFTGKLRADGSLSGNIFVAPLGYDGSFSASKDTAQKTSGK